MSLAHTYFYGSAIGPLSHDLQVFSTLTDYTIFGSIWEGLYQKFENNPIGSPCWKVIQKGKAICGFCPRPMGVGRGVSFKEVQTIRSCVRLCLCHGRWGLPMSFGQRIAGFQKGSQGREGEAVSPPMQSVWFKQNSTITFFRGLYLVWFGLSSIFAEALNGSDDGLRKMVVSSSVDC